MTKNPSSLQSPALKCQSTTAKRSLALRAYDSVGEARASLGKYLDFYNRRRPHSSLGRKTPDEAKKGFGFAGEWTVRRQNGLLALCFGIQLVNNP